MVPGFRACSAFRDPAAAEDVAEGPEETAQVHAETEALGVFAVEAGFLGDSEVVAAVDLGPAGEADRDVVGAVFFALLDEVVLVPERGPGADDAHVAGKDVEDLRKFVDRKFAHHAADARDALVGVLKKMGRDIARSIDAHGPELQDVEVGLMDADSLLAEEDRAARVELDRDDDSQEERQKKDKAKKGQKEVRDAFDDQIGLTHGSPPSFVLLRTILPFV